MVASVSVSPSVVRATTTWWKAGPLGSVAGPVIVLGRAVHNDDADTMPTGVPGPGVDATGEGAVAAFEPPHATASIATHATSTSSRRLSRRLIASSSAKL